MCKMIGGLLIILSCTWWGVEKSREISIHRKELEELERIFTLLQSEMQYVKRPIGEIFAKLKRQEIGRYQRWMGELSMSETALGKRTFQELWRTSIDHHFKETFLTKRELEELKEIGNHIGYSEAIRLYLVQLDNSIQVTKEEEKEKKKLYQSMGILSGIFLVLVFI